MVMKAPGKEIESLAGAHRTLTPLLGHAASGAFALALLASGLASSMTGTLAGQMVLDGFLGLRLPLVVRRTVTMIPAIVVLAFGVGEVVALVWSQVVLSLRPAPAQPAARSCSACGPLAPTCDPLAPEPATRAADAPRRPVVRGPAPGSVPGLPPRGRLTVDLAALAAARDPEHAEVDRQADVRRRGSSVSTPSHRVASTGSALHPLADGFAARGQVAGLARCPLRAGLRDPAAPPVRRRSSASRRPLAARHSSPPTRRETAARAARSASAASTVGGLRSRYAKSPTTNQR